MKANALVYLSTFLSLIINMDSRTFEIEIKRCEECIDKKAYKKANESISNAIHINKDSAHAWYLKAKVSIGLLDYNGAISACERAVSIDQKDEYIKLKDNIENFINMNGNAFKIADYPNKIDNMVFLTNNISVLSKKRLNNIVYQKILDDIAGNVEKDSSDDDILMTVEKLTRNFINLDFKPNSSNSQRRVIGRYGFKNALIDSNNSKTLQIAAMIHELSHHLLFEIFKNCIMYFYDTQNTDTIEAFGWYSLTSDIYWHLMNEYCAHTVECHYMKLRNYESVNNILRKNKDLDSEKVKKAVELGNGLALDIIYILDGFLTGDMVEEIKMQFLSDKVILLKKDCEVECERQLGNVEKFDMINSILRQNLINIKINFSYNELNQFKRIFANVRG